MITCDDLGHAAAAASLANERYINSLDHEGLLRACDMTERYFRANKLTDLDLIEYLCYETI